MFWRLAFLIMFWLGCAQWSPAQTYRLRVDESDTIRSHGTACCVGHTDDGDAVLVTARHNLQLARTIEIRVGTRWHRCTLAASHPEADVAVLEAAGVRLKHFARIRPARRQERVAIGGYGGEYHGGQRREFDAIVLSDDTAVGVAGARPVLGDSGGFVAATTDAGAELLGIIIGWERDRPTHTAMEPARRIIECLQRRYRCGPAGCPPVWIRPGVTQPFFGPIPIGPPRPIGIVDPLPPIAILPPARPPVSDSPPDTGAGRFTQDQVDNAVSAWLDSHADEIRGRDGRDGATGPAGPPGRSVRAEEINAIVNAWLDSNRDDLRGPAGPPGTPGSRGPAGPAGVAGQAGTVDADQIRQLVRAEVERLMADVPGEPQLPLPADEVSERKRLLYFTSRLGCPACVKTDEMVRKMKDKGYPVTIIDLDPRETEIKGVPRVFHPSSGRDVLGPTAVADYLASVGY